MDTSKIEIDIDVHKAIENERSNFGESQNDALRRLLGLDTTTCSNPSKHDTQRPWSGKGVILESGTDLWMEYNGQVFEGVIDDGVWLVEGQRYSSPSAAASGVAMTKAGKSPSLNGWEYWSVRRPNYTNYRRLNLLRQ